MEKLDEFLESKNKRLLLIFGVSLLVVFPTYFLGIYNGPDISQHFQFADTFERAILAGDFYPSWGAYENLGYGSVGLRFYPPLFSFLLALAHIVVGNWHIATCLIFLLFTFTGSIGAYLWAKEFLVPNEAFWAAIVFALMPYHLNQIYNVSVYAEFAGCSVLPFCFLYATRVCRTSKMTDVIGLAIAYAILILIHLPSAVIGSLCLLVYSLAMLPKERKIITLSNLFLSSILGLSASSIYWLKMVTELSWMRHTKFRSDVVFDYRQNFLLTSAWFDGRQYWFLNIVLLVTLLMVSFAFWSLYKNKADKSIRNLRGAFVLFFVSVFMTTVISLPIWIVFPFIQDVQFPFRWLTISVVSGSIITAAGIKPIRELAQTSLYWQKTVKSMMAFLAFGMIVIFCLTWISVSNSYLPANGFDEWVNNKANSMGFDFFWTTQTKEEVFDIKEKVVAAERSITISSWQPYKRGFIVEAGSRTDARIATLYYPHWKATVNKEPVEVKQSSDGAMLIPLPSETATVEIIFNEPFYIQFALVISFLTWILMLTSLVILGGKNRFSKLNYELQIESFDPINAEIQ